MDGAYLLPRSPGAWCRPPPRWACAARGPERTHGTPPGSRTPAPQSYPPCTHTHAHTRTHTYTNTKTHTQKHTHTPTNTHTGTKKNTHTHRKSQTQTNKHSKKHTHSHTHIVRAPKHTNRNIQRHTHRHTHVHTNIHTHTQTHNLISDHCIGLLWGFPINCFNCYKPLPILNRISFFSGYSSSGISTVPHYLQPHLFMQIPEEQKQSNGTRTTESERERERAGPINAWNTNT